MIKTIIAATTIAIAASSATAGVLIENDIYGGPTGSDIGVHYTINATFADYNQCKANVNASAKKYVNEYQGKIVSSDSKKNGKIYIYDVTVEHQWANKGYTTLSCVFFS